MSTIRRRPYTPDACEAVLEFCAQHPASDFSPALLRRFLTTLTTSPAGIVRLSADGAEVLVAAVMDAVSSTADCAVLDLLGICGPATPALLSRLLEDAEGFVAAGARAGLEVPLTPPWKGHAPVLVARGYTEAFTMFDMETPPGPPPAALPLPGPGWRWAEARADSLPAYYAVMRAAMASVPGSFIGSFDDFRAAALSRKPPAMLLLCGERVAGFVRVEHRADGLGYLHILGRHPDFRGHGLGVLLLTRGMRELAAGGASRFGLDVSAPNTAALALYRRLGFAVTGAVPMYRRMLP